MSDKENQIIPPETAVAENRKVEKEEVYRTMFDSTEQGFCLLEILQDNSGQPVDYRFLEVNRAFEKMTGIPNEAAIGDKTARELVPNLEDKWVEIYGRIALTGEAVRFVENSPAMNRVFDVHAFRIGDEKSRTVALLFNDISEQKRAEENLRESEENLRYTVELNPQVTWTATPDGAIESFSERWLEMTGLTREYALGDGWLSIQHPEDKDAAFAAWARSIETGESYDIEHRIRLADGAYRWVRSRAYPRRNDFDGRIIRWHGATEDIDQHKQADEDLRESQKMLKLAMAGSRMGAWSRDMATDAVYWSPELEAIFGLAAGTFSGTLGGFRDYVHPEDKQRIADEVQRAIDEKTDYIIEFRFRHADGSLRWMEGRGQAVYAPDGTPTKVYGIGIDITERKREELDRQFLLEIGEKIRFGELKRENTLSDVAEMTSRHLDAARCLFIEIDEAADRGTIRYEHRRRGDAPVAGEYKISDYSPQTLAEIKSGRIIVNHDAERDLRTADIYRETYEPYDECAYVSVPLFTGGQWTAIFWISDDSPRRWTERETALIAAVGERAWLAAEKRRNEKALRQSRERLQMAMDAAKIYSWEMNLATRQIDWSNNLERVIGFSLPNDYQITLNDLVHADDKETLESKIFDAVNQRETYESEFRLVNPANGETVWMRGQGVLADQEAGDPPRFVGITQNIHERKKAEHERENLLRREQDARRQAEEASRLKDEFLATVSHELRTPLNAILGWSQMLISSKFSEADTRRAVETIYRNAKSQAQLIEDILDVSRIITGKLRIETEPTMLAPIIQTAIETLRPSIEAKNIKLQLLLEFETKPVLADSDRMLQVFWNLISNAVKFTPENGRVGVELENVNRQIKITVSDTGQGIEPEFLPFVFDRFRQADGTSTRTHGGLGLGLSIVRHIVELHGGTVEVVSAGAGAGAAFTVYLPVWETPQNAEKIIGDDGSRDFSIRKQAPESSNTEGDDELKGLRVLLIDDEQDALEMLTLMLRQSGITVEPQTNAADALEFIKERTPQIIISDIGMPEQDGYGFIEKLRELPPEKGGSIPAIALTAYSGADEKTRVLSSGFQIYLPKPVDSSELFDALKSLRKELNG